MLRIESASSRRRPSGWSVLATRAFELPPAIPRAILAFGTRPPFAREIPRSHRSSHPFMKRKRIDPTAPDATPARAAHPLWFVGRFLLGLAVGQVAIAWFPAIEAWAIRSTLGSLRGVAWGMRLAGLQGGVDGTSFHLGPNGVEIVGECTPLMPTLVMAAAMTAYPAPRRAQLAGIAAGAAVLWAFNLLRIGSLVAILAWRPRSFDFVHMYLWQTITLLVVLVIFVIWTRLQRSRGAEP